MTKSNPPISSSWISWIRRNIERGCSRESMEKIMLEKAFSAKDIAAAFVYVDNNPPEKPDILISQHYLTKQKCQFYIDYIESQQSERAEVVEASEGPELKKTISDGRITDRINIDGVVGDVLQIMIDIYNNKINTHYDTSIEWFERPQFLRYLPGGEYRNHADAENWNPEKKQWIQNLDRQYSSVLYLNDNFEGGSLYFENFNLRIQPQTGLLVCFPADHHYCHAAEPLKSGKRYVLVCWAAARGFKRVQNEAPARSTFL